MKKIWLVVIIALLCSDVMAESVVFGFTMKEKKKYTTENTMNIEMNMDIEAEEDVRDILRQQGIMMPIQNIQKQFSRFVYETAETDSLGGIPFHGYMDSNYNDVTMNGLKNYNMDEMTRLQKEMKIIGQFKNDQFLIEKFTMDTLSGELLAAIESSIQNMINTIPYPDEPMEIGDSFEQSVPLSLPLGGMIQMDYFITTIYTLKSIENSKANFDIVQTYTLLTSDETMNIALEGEGSGVMVYDIEEMYQTYLTTSSNMTAKFTSGAMVLNSQIISESVVEVTIDDI